jgi:hypothetical protein
VGKPLRKHGYTLRAPNKSVEEKVIAAFDAASADYQF